VVESRSSTGSVNEVAGAPRAVGGSSRGSRPASSAPTRSRSPSSVAVLAIVFVAVK
jgi:hypothetical protein